MRGEEHVVAEGGEEVIEDGRRSRCEGWERAVFMAGGSGGEGAGFRLEVQAAETGAAVVGWGEGKRSHCDLGVVGSWVVRPTRVCHGCFG